MGTACLRTTWQLPLARMASTLTITRSLNNAQRSVVQAEPLSVGYNLLTDPILTKMKILMKVTMRMKTMYLYGEMQPLASLQASVTRLTVPNAVKAGMTAILMPKNIVAKTRPSSST